MEVYFDACIAIYLVEEHPVYAPIITDRLRDAVWRIAYSPLVEMECLVLPIREQRMGLAKRFGGFFALNHRLVIDDEVFRIATKLRAHYGIKTPDALHLATATRYHCDELWTNDNRLSKITETNVINVLSVPFQQTSPVETKP